MQKIIILLGLWVSFSAIAFDKPWLLIDTKAKKIEVRLNKKVQAVFFNISLGQKGAGQKGQKGDAITPLGEYKITHINHKSRFKTFFGFNYPSLQDAEVGLSFGIISYASYLAIRRAHATGQVPPQNTPLGGALGIHGVGFGNPKVQGIFDWTQGCIALSNTQIDALEQWVYVGMPVHIK